MQVYILDKNAVKAAQLLADYPARARSTNLREGQQILSVCLHNRGLPTLFKQDGTRYSGINHKNHPLVKWFSETDERTAWLHTHLRNVAVVHYPQHHIRLLKHILEDKRVMCLNDQAFLKSTGYLDSIPWFPAKEYTGPESMEAYLEWKYGGSRRSRRASQKAGMNIVNGGKK